MSIWRPPGPTPIEQRQAKRPMFDIPRRIGWVGGRPDGAPQRLPDLSQSNIKPLSAGAILRKITAR